MVAGQLGVELGERRLDLEVLFDAVAVADEVFHGERLHIDLVEAFLHRGVVDLARGIGEVPRIAGESAWHDARWDDSHLPLCVDDVWPDEKLLRFLMDHAVRRRAANAFRSHDLFQLRRDLVELVARAKRQMRPIRDDPQPVRPRHHRARAALALVVEHRERWIDAADVAGLLRAEQAYGTRGKHGKQKVGLHSLSKAEVGDTDNHRVLC